MNSAFIAASEAAHSWVNTVAMVARRGNELRQSKTDIARGIDAMYRLLMPSNNTAFARVDLVTTFEKHAQLLDEMCGQLATVSDGPMKWPNPIPQGTYPPVWSSAHEAAAGICRLALYELVAPLDGILDSNEQATAARQLLTTRADVLTLTPDFVAEIQERIRRERAKITHANIPTSVNSKWSEIKAPADWRKDLGLSESAMRRHVQNGDLVVNKVNLKKWRIRLDTLHKFTGGK